MAVLAGEGCTLGYSADGTAYALVSQTVSIGSLDTSFPEVDVTHLASTSKEYRAGLKESGTLSFQFYLDPDNATHTALEAEDDEFFLQITLTDATPATYTFACVKTSFSYSGMEVDSNVTVDCSVRINGDITIA